jgi:hypothetical protein
MHAVMLITEQALRLQEDSLQAFYHLQEEHRAAFDALGSLFRQILDIIWDLISRMPLLIDTTCVQPDEVFAKYAEEPSGPQHPSVVISQLSDKAVHSIVQLQRAGQTFYEFTVPEGKGASYLHGEPRSGLHHTIIAQFVTKTEKMLSPIKTAGINLHPPPIEDRGYTKVTQEDHHEPWTSVIEPGPGNLRSVPVTSMQYLQARPGIANDMQGETGRGRSFRESSTQSYSVSTGQNTEEHGSFLETLKKSVMFATQLHHSLLTYVGVSQTSKQMQEGVRISKIPEPVPPTMNPPGHRSDRSGVEDAGSAIGSGDATPYVTTTSDFRSSLFLYQEYGKNLFSSWYERARVRGEENSEEVRKSEIDFFDLLAKGSWVYEKLLTGTMREFPRQKMGEGYQSLTGGSKGSRLPVSPGRYPVYERGSTTAWEPGTRERSGKSPLPEQGARRAGFIDIPAIFPVNRSVVRVTPHDRSLQGISREEKVVGGEPLSTGGDQRSLVESGAGSSMPDTNPITNLAYHMANFQNQMVQQDYATQATLPNHSVKSLYSLLHRQAGGVGAIVNETLLPIILPGNEVSTGILERAVSSTPLTEGLSTLQIASPMALHLGQGRMVQVTAITPPSSPTPRPLGYTVPESGTSAQARTTNIQIHNTFNISVKGVDSSSEGELRDLGRKLGTILADEMRRYGSAP